MMKFSYRQILVVLFLINCFMADANYLSAEDRCRKFEFRCANAKCIHLPLKCNGRDDCGDNSDEIMCENDSFECNDTQVISVNNLCNGINECSNDEDPKICEKHKCSKDHFLCRTSPMNCIDINAVCNNVNDCSDGSDESPDACEFLRNSKLVECNTATQFRCANKQFCISKIYVCDGNKDCADKSDEENCPELNKSKPDDGVITNGVFNTTLKCSFGDFYCGDASPRKCIPKDWVCDSSYDCEITNLDELNCPNFKCPTFKPRKCNTTDICYENEKYCDGYQNCPDSSDESNCPPHKNVIHCDPITEFKCFKRNTCIPFSKVCDEKNDCGDNSDERPGGLATNCRNRPCEINNGGCDQVCVSMFSERKCLCRSGYEISATNATKCVDIDECVNGFSCSHLCKNEPGSYKCECFDGFYKSQPNSSQCLAVGEKLLLFSSKNSVRGLSLLHQHMDELSGTNDRSNHLQVIGLDFDYKSGNIFWSQFDPYPAIVQFKYRSSSRQSDKIHDLVSSRIHSPVGIAYDWVHGLLFWTDLFYNDISVLNVTSGQRRVLLKLNNDSKIQSIVVHPKYRRLYWTDSGYHPRIMSMGIDGQDIKTIINDGLMAPNGLSIDYYLNHLYWVDARARNIKAYNLKSGQQREVVSHFDAHGYSLDVFEDWLYVSDWNKQMILQIHKITGQQHVLITTPKPLGLKLMHQLAQPEISENVCLNNPCQHLCLPSALNIKNLKPFRCQCPDYSELLPDQIHCSIIRDSLNASESRSSKIKSGKLNSDISNFKSFQKTRIYLIAGFVSVIVVIVLLFVVIVGIVMHRNYMKKVIKRATNFNNPIYYRKPSTHDIQMLNPESLEETYDITSSNSINREGDESLQMIHDK